MSGTRCISFSHSLKNSFHHSTSNRLMLGVLLPEWIAPFASGVILVSYVVLELWSMMVNFPYWISRTDNGKIYYVIPPLSESLYRVLHVWSWIFALVVIDGSILEECALSDHKWSTFPRYVSACWIAVGWM